MEGKGSVTVTKLSVDPSQIYQGDSVRATLEVYNTGKLTATAHVGKNGELLLRNYCPDIFSLDESAYTISTSRTTQKKNSYTIGPGEKLRAQWKLDQKGAVPLYGYTCHNVNFQVPFEYKVKAYRQVQFKQSRDVSGSPGLQSESSQGPMSLTISALTGVTGKPNTFIPEDGKVTVVMRLINNRPQENDYTKGLISVDRRSLSIWGTAPLDFNESLVEASELPSKVKTEDNKYDIDGDTYYWVSHRDGEYSKPYCSIPEGGLTMYEGKSATIKCSVPVPDNIDISEIAEIDAQVAYTYVKDAGTKTIKVKTRG